MDVSRKSVLVDWETFLKLYCIFEIGGLEKNKLINFWAKFFDFEMKGYCEKNEYIDLIEKLVRGKCLKEKSEFSS